MNFEFFGQNKGSADRRKTLPKTTGEFPEVPIPDRQALEQILAVMPQIQFKLLVAAKNHPQYSNAFFQEEIVEPQRYHYYLCSSPRVRSVVQGALQTLGVPKS